MSFRPFTIFRKNNDDDDDKHNRKVEEREKQGLAERGGREGHSLKRSKGGREEIKESDSSQAGRFESPFPRFTCGQNQLLLQEKKRNQSKDFEGPSKYLIRGWHLPIGWTSSGQHFLWRECGSLFFFLAVPLA